MDFDALYEREKDLHVHKLGNHVHSDKCLRAHPAFVFGSKLPEKEYTKTVAVKETKKGGGSRAKPKPRPVVAGECFYRDWHCGTPTGLRIKIKQNSAFGHGGLVWDCSLVLARFMESGFDAKYWKGKSVLELGSGTGLVGLVTAMLGAHRVVLSDLAEIVPLLEDNLRINQPVLRKAAANVEAVDFCWGSTDPKVLMKDHRRSSWKAHKEVFLKRLSALSKQTPPSDFLSDNPIHSKTNGSTRHFDVVLASDVAYDPTAFKPLKEVWSEVCGPDTRIFLSHEWRDKAKEQAFFETLKPEFIFDVIPTDKLDSDYRTDDICIFCIRRVPKL